MYQAFLTDARGYELLLKLDAETAAEARAQGCRCGGRLHAAPYQRKPRGGPDSLPAEMDRRFSFTCDRQGCRRRVTPPSLRFLDRKVFFSVAVLLLPLLTRGLSPQRLDKLLETFKVTRRTVERWARFWRETFPASRRWQSVRGLFASPPAREAMPQSLVESFPLMVDLQDRIVSALRIVTGVGLKDPPGLSHFLKGRSDPQKI